MGSPRWPACRALYVRLRRQMAANPCQRPGYRPRGPRVRDDHAGGDEECPGRERNEPNLEVDDRGAAGRLIDSLPQAVTAIPCTSIIISGWAKPCAVIAALAGKSLPNSSVRSSVMRVVKRASLRNTVMVTMSLSLAPACASVFSILRKVCLNCASKSPASDFPESSACPVCPAMKIIRPAPSVTTAGENERLTCQV